MIGGTQAVRCVSYSSVQGRIQILSLAVTGCKVEYHVLVGECKVESVPPPGTWCVVLVCQLYPTADRGQTTGSTLQQSVVVGVRFTSTASSNGTHD